MGLRLSSLIYEYQGFRKSIGMYLPGDLDGNLTKTSYKFFRNYNDCAAMDFVSSVYLTFKSSSKTVMYEAWGGTHRTYLVYSTTMTLDELTRLLYEKEFKIGPKSVSYRVERNLIKQRHSRKTTVKL